MNLASQIGNISIADSVRTKRARIHQGWWRAFVLNREPGLHPFAKEKEQDSAGDKSICNTLPLTAGETENFITAEIADLAINTAKQHNESKTSAGMMEINRLKTNLLSSQPLCFNFFGLLADRDLALRTVRSFYPEITGFKKVKFEYAPTPKNDFTRDNSAFDVALEVTIGDAVGLIGIECKYTEPFSPTEYRNDRYKEIYDSSKSFIGSYEELTESRYNQLFRNQLIAESLIQKGRYDFAKTALFCAPDDTRAKTIATEFGSKIKSDFRIIDFFEFITAIQKLDITPSQRNCTMLLWARYLAHELSEAAYSQF